MTREQAMVIVAALKAAFPRQELTDETLDVYTKMLLDLSPADGQAAVEKLLKRSRFFPTIAEIREAVLDLHYPLPNSSEAWELVTEAGKDAMRSAPTSRAGSLMMEGLPMIARRALALVGGGDGYLYSENVNALRAQFLRVYADLRDSALAGEENERRRALEREPQQSLTTSVPLPALKEVAGDA